MLKTNTENPRRFRLMTVLIMTVFAILLLAGYNNFGSKARYINDYYDRADYADRGVWILTGQVPYRDIPIEYPQVPAVLFGLVTWTAKTILPASWPLPAGTAVLWSVLMMIVFLVASWQMFKLLPEGRKKYAWLMFLPSVIYFSLNRFDILSVYMGMIVFMFVRDKRFGWAAIFLAVGVFTKWYLGLTIPFILAYEYSQSRKYPWRSLSAFMAVSTLILLPTYLLGGFQAVWQPYGWHLGRVMEPGTLIWFINNLVIDLSGGKADMVGAVSIFTIVQFLGVLTIFLMRMDTYRKVVLASAISILVFILFSRIYSPQWWLWVLPFLILSIDRLVDTILIVVYDILNYVTFPVVYDLTGRESQICLILNMAGLVILAVLIIHTITKLKQSQLARQEQDHLIV